MTSMLQSGGREGVTTMPAADDETIEAALRLLAGVPEYAWLTAETAAQWFTAAQVAEKMGVSDDAVRHAASRGEIPGAVLYKQQVGWRLPRSGLALYFASLSRRGHHHRDGDGQAG